MAKSKATRRLVPFAKLYAAVRNTKQRPIKELKKEQKGKRKRVPEEEAIEKKVKSKSIDELYLPSRRSNRLVHNFDQLQLISQQTICNNFRKVLSDIKYFPVEGTKNKKNDWNKNELENENGSGTSMIWAHCFNEIAKSMVDIKAILANETEKITFEDLYGDLLFIAWNKFSLWMIKMLKSNNDISVEELQEKLASEPELHLIRFHIKYQFFTYKDGFLMDEKDLQLELLESLLSPYRDNDDGYYGQQLTMNEFCNSIITDTEAGNMILGCIHVKYFGYHDKGSTE